MKGNKQVSNNSVGTKQCLDLAANFLKTGRYEEAFDTLKPFTTKDKSAVSQDVTRIRIVALRKLGRFAQAHAELMGLKSQKSLNLEERTLLLDNYTKVNFHNNFSSIIDEIADLLSSENIDGFKIAGKVCDLFLAAYPELSNETQQQLNHPLTTDTRFIKLLRIIPFPNRDIEYFLVNVRKQLLLQALTKGQIDDDYIEICISIVHQNHINEHVHYISDEEKQFIDDLKSLLSLQMNDSNWSPAVSEAVIVLLGLYEPMRNIFEQLDSPENFEWPDSIKSIIQTDLLDWRTQLKLGRDIPNLTPISIETPIEVINQYHTNPYPKWRNCHMQAAVSLGKIIEYLCPQAKIPEIAYTPNLKVLIAGCGTGKQAIESSMVLPKAKITAFDLSRTSLGYAKFKANQLKVTRIDFYQGDILCLDSLDEKFDLIECCGVLHHMPDPDRGLKQLISRLTPNGIIRIDLYSRLARQDVIERKQQIQELNLVTDIDTIRRFRWAVLAQNTDTAMLKFRDFYNTSECRDLLFHTHEKQYSLIEIGEMLKANSLRFIAMHCDENRYHLFKQKFPSDDATAIEKWHLLEQENPFMFAGMYSFWCTPV